MDIRKVKKLIELLEESGIDELEIKEGEESVRISRHSKQPAYAPQPVYAQAPAPVAAPVAAAAPSADAAPAAAPKLHGTVARPPMVGTIYRAASPNRATRRARSKSCTSAICSSVGVRPVPMAQTGS